MFWSDESEADDSQGLDVGNYSKSIGSVCTEVAGWVPRGLSELEMMQADGDRSSVEAAVTACRRGTSTRNVRRRGQKGLSCTTKVPAR